MTRFYLAEQPRDEDRWARAMAVKPRFPHPALDTNSPHVLADHDPRQERRRHPLLIEWASGSDEIADFTWAFDYLVACEPDARRLAEHATGIGLKPVEMVQDPKVKRPARVTKRSTRRVWLPDEGPFLAEIWTTRWVDLDWKRSAVTIERTCSCGFAYWQPVGIEDRKWESSGAGEGEWRRVTRDPSAGLIVNRSALAHDEIFLIVGFHGNWVMVTERVKQFIEAFAWTNIAFREMGDIVDG